MYYGSNTLQEYSGCSTNILMKEQEGNKKREMEEEREGGMDRGGKKEMCRHEILKIFSSLLR